MTHAVTIKMQEGRRRKASLQICLPLTLFVRFEKGYSRFAWERVLETEHKLHILTPLLWPSRCVFLVLLMLGSTPSGGSERPLGRVWLSIPHLVSNFLEVCWQLHRGFPRTPLVGCGLPYHIWSLLSGILLATPSGVSEDPFGRVWSSLPHLVSTVWNSTGNSIGGFRDPLFLTTSGLYCLEFYWQLLWHPNSTELNNNSTPTRSPTGSLKSNV